MSSTLIDSVKSVFTDTLLSKIAVLLGETEGNVQKAIHGAIPMVLTDILHKSYFPEGTAKVDQLARQAASNDFFGHVHELNMNPGGLVAGSVLLNKGGDFARSLLGARTDSVISEISRYAGISVPSASFITGVASFASLDAIGRHITNSNIDGHGLPAWLQTQADSILHAIPAGLQVKQALGIDHYPWEKRMSARRNTGLYVIIGLIVLALFIFILYRSCGHTEVTTAANDTTVVNTVPPPTGKDTASSVVMLILPNKKVLNVDKGGTEERLVNFH